MESNTNTQETTVAVANRSQVTDDFKHALLAVSLLANAFVLIGWVALQITSRYDYQIALFLFYR